MHPFEESGHGPGPFTAVGRSYNEDGTHCSHCSTFIKEECEIENGEGRTFIVGNRCVNLALEEDQALRSSYERVDRIYRARVRIEKKRMKGKLMRMKHPVHARRAMGETLYHYFRYMLNARQETALRVLSWVEEL